MKVERLEDKNDDLLVVNAARVSFGKWKDELDDSDGKLVKYLAEHNHWTPFGHPIFCFKHTIQQGNVFEYVAASLNDPGIKFLWEDTDWLSGNVTLYESGSLYAFLNKGWLPTTIFQSVGGQCPVSTKALGLEMIVEQPPWGTEAVYGEDIPAPLRTARFRIKIPIFVAREWFRHTKGFVRNEISRRYVDSKPECWLPDDGYRIRHASKKQGSAQEAPEKNAELVKSAQIMTDMVVKFYETLLENGVAPEMARHILPQSMYTEFIETAYVEDYERLLGLRLQPDAQKEIQIVAAMLKEELYA